MPSGISIRLTVSPQYTVTDRHTDVCIMAIADHIGFAYSGQLKTVFSSTIKDEGREQVGNVWKNLLRIHVKGFDSFISVLLFQRRLSPADDTCPAVAYPRCRPITRREGVGDGDAQL